MIKKQSAVVGLARQTEPFPSSPGVESAVGAGDETTIISVSVTRAELARLSAIAAEQGVTQSNIVAYALRRFIRKYDAGKLGIAKVVQARASEPASESAPKPAPKQTSKPAPKRVPKPAPKPAPPAGV